MRADPDRGDAYSISTKAAGQAGALLFTGCACFWCAGERPFSPCCLAVEALQLPASAGTANLWKAGPSCLLPDGSADSGRSPPEDCPPEAVRSRFQAPP